MEKMKTLLDKFVYVLVNYCFCALYIYVHFVQYGLANVEPAYLKAKR
jgi:hypothetical protein